MARVNVKVPSGIRRTHEGAASKVISPEQELRRTVMACMLWENNFYESGQSVAGRIESLVSRVSPEVAVDIAIEAREVMHLRHVPLLIADAMVAAGGQHRTLAGVVLERVIQRPDELTEFLAIYWRKHLNDPGRKNKRKLAGSVKRGLARAFTKFNEYSLAKYNRDGAVKLRDVLFLTHPRPRSPEQQEVWNRLVEGKLTTPDTWEVELSAGKNKGETFTRLLQEKKLGGLALLRNLRNMLESKVDKGLIRTSLLSHDFKRVLPFRFVAAARYAPELEPELETAMFKATAGMPKLQGKTVLLVDHSGSMNASLSARSDLTRFDAACALAMLLREIADDVDIIPFSTGPKLVAPRRGFALRDAIHSSMWFNATYTEKAKLFADERGYDRIIIITDEQSHQSISRPHGKGYVINVASYQNGIGYGEWNTINGWSEGVISYIQAFESLDQ